MSLNIKPVVVHLIYRFDIGGLERVMINCINAMQDDKYRHVVIALTQVSSFSQHLNSTVEVHQLNKKAGKDLASHWRLFKLLRQIKPSIIHTYNLAAIEYHLVAKLAGVKGRIHAEHGRDNSDPHGLNKKHNLLRKMLAPLIQYFVPVSTDLAMWLDNTVNIAKQKVVLIRNGINIDDFYRQQNDKDSGLRKAIRYIHVARLDLVKDQASLISAFARLIKNNEMNTDNVHLTMVGDGSEMGRLKTLAQNLEIAEHVEFSGAKNNIAELLSMADVFVLSSIAEGIPMTVLEAMASSLPIISTNVGGLPELIIDDGSDKSNGQLVEKQNTDELCQAMATYVNNPQLIDKHGKQARLFIENNFSEKSMVSAYLNLYNKSLGHN